MIEALRLELIPFGVRVVLIEPGPYQTELHDNERLAAAGGGADSPYADLLASYRRQSAKLPRQDDLGPLIDVIERAATSENPASALAGRADVAHRRPPARFLPGPPLRMAHAARVSRSDRSRECAYRRAIIGDVVPSDKLTRREVDFVLRRAAEIDTQSPTAQTSARPTRR